MSYTDGFYERHLAYIGGRKDVWYVPTGPLYAYKTLADRTEVRALDPAGKLARYDVSNDLDAKIYRGVVTLTFTAPAAVRISASGVRLAERSGSPTDRWDEQFVRRDGDRVYVTVRPNTVLEFE